MGLTLVGLALAANTFYGRAGLYWVVFFFGLAATAGTYLNYLYREIEWERKGWIIHPRCGLICCSIPPGSVLE